MKIIISLCMLILLVGCVPNNKINGMTDDVNEITNGVSEMTKEVNSQIEDLRQINLDTKRNNKFFAERFDYYHNLINFSADVFIELYCINDTKVNKIFEENNITFIVNCSSKEDK